MTVAYKEALVELLEILKHTDQEDVNKIPKKLLVFFRKNASTTYKFKIDENVEIRNLKLKKETKGLLTMIYRNYWCSIEERPKYDKLLQNNQKKFDDALREKYNPDKIFEKKQTIQTEPEICEEQTQYIEQSITEYKETFFTKIVERFKNFIQKFAHSN
jgi:hypothetical protein